MLFRNHDVARDAAADPMLRAALKELTSHSLGVNDGWVAPLTAQPALEAVLGIGAWRVARVMRRLAQCGYIERRPLEFGRRGAAEFRLTASGYRALGVGPPGWLRTDRS